MACWAAGVRRLGASTVISVVLSKPVEKTAATIDAWDRGLPARMFTGAGGTARGPRAGLRRSILALAKQLEQQSEQVDEIEIER
jgi:hypothetical protein